MMRNMVLWVLLALAWSTAQAQTAGDTDALAQADSLATQAYTDEDYAQSLQWRQRQSELLLATVGETDSTYIMSLTKQARCYYRLQQIDEAVATAQQATDLYGQHVSRTSETYAFLLDNLALYQTAADQYDAALANSKQALALYEQLNHNDHDMAVMLMHAAEVSHYVDHAADAVAYELRALAIIKQLYGEHSSDYLDEAAYLVTYYEANGEQERAEKLQARIDNLKEEADRGIVDLPEPVEFKSEEQARAHNADALRCMEYLLSHYVVASQVDEAARYVLGWTVVSPDCSVKIDKNVMNMASDPKTKIYFVAYIAACGKYALETGLKDFTFDTYQNTMIDVLNYYMANKKITGSVSYLEKHIKAHQKSRDKLVELLQKNYAAMKKEEK